MSADLEKIIAYIEQLFERHESHKDRAMEASSQSHALMNHVKQTNGLANSCLNQVNQVSNSQWTHSDQLAGLQESLREQDDKLKKQSDALSKVQGQLEKVILKLTPAMPTKAPPPPAPGTSTPPSAASSSTPTPPAPQALDAGAPYRATPGMQPATHGNGSTGDPSERSDGPTSAAPTFRQFERACKVAPAYL